MTNLFIERRVVNGYGNEICFRIRKMPAFQKFGFDKRNGNGIEDLHADIQERPQDEQRIVRSFFNSVSDDDTQALLDCIRVVAGDGELPIVAGAVDEFLPADNAEVALSGLLYAALLFNFFQSAVASQSTTTTPPMTNSSTTAQGNENL